MSEPGALHARTRLRDVVRLLAELHGHPRRAVTSQVVVGTIAGLLEAVALVLFMYGALHASGRASAATAVAPFLADATSLQLLVMAGVAIIAAAALHADLARRTADVSLEVLVAARRRTLHSRLRANWSAQAESPDGSVEESVFGLAQKVSSASMVLMSSLNSAIILVTLLATAIVVSPVAAPLLVLSVIPIAIILRPVIRLAQRRSSAAVREETSLSEEVASTTVIALELQAFGVEEAQLARLDALNEHAARSLRSARFSTRLAAFWFKDLAVLMLIVIVAAINAVWGLSDGSTTAAVLVVIRALGYAQQTYNTHQQLTELAPAVEELAARTARFDQQQIVDGSQPVEQLGTITFESVSYAYPDGRHALRDVSFTIEHGRVLGIVGRSGAGKSTIAELLLRLRQPTGGAVLASGVDVTNLRLADWRRLVAFVPQEPRVLRRSIADNIAFLRDGIDAEAVEHASRLAHVHDAIESLPEGYGTVLGAQSRGLSGGQRQRLAIARALVAQPALIVLDEPTSALDGQSELEIQRTLKELRHTVTLVVIAHRLSTLDVCDDLLVLDAGRVVAFGPSDEVRRTHPFFAERALIDGAHPITARDATLPQVDAQTSSPGGQQPAEAASPN